MRRKIKNLLEAVVILITLLACTSFLFNIGIPKTERPVDFYAISKEISLNELIAEADDRNISLYLPSELPNELVLTAIYFKQGSFIAIIVYSAEGNEDYKTAELTIELSVSNFQPTYEDLLSLVEDSQYEFAVEINGWPVLINEHAYSGGNEESREKYGDYILLVMTWIENVYYMIGCPTLTTNESIQLVGSMCLITKSP